MIFGKDERVENVSGLSFLLRTYPPNQQKLAHIHSDWTFFLVLRGGMVEHCGGRQYVVGDQQLIIQSEGVEHSSTVSNVGMRALFLQVPDSWLHCHQISAPRSRIYELANDSRALEMIAVAVELSSGDSEPLEIEERVLEICSMSDRHGAYSGRGNPGWLKAVEDRIHDTYDQAVSLAQLAESIGVHPVHLARVFRAKNRRSVSSYLRAVRVVEALRRSTQMPLGMAATECGFSDQAHFCRSVRRELRRTPREVLSALRGE